jgi:hypothetical protein
MIDDDDDDDDECGVVSGMRIGRENLMYSEKTCPSSGLQPGPPQWETGDYPPELWHGLQLAVILSLIRHVYLD